MQERASFVRYGERLSLEQRANILAQTPDYRSGAGVKSHWVRSVMRHESWARGMSYRELERSPRFKDIWEQWQYLRDKRVGSTDARGIKRSGKYWAGQRFSFLKRYGVLRYVNGEWIS